jgi:hypothetical protein
LIVHRENCVGAKLVKGNASVQLGTDLLIDAMSVVAEFLEMEGEKGTNYPYSC